jgi:hypothetical protein
MYLRVYIISNAFGVSIRGGKECQVVPLNLAPAMTSYTSEMGSAIAVAVALGVGVGVGYIIARPHASEAEQLASDLHTKAWGKPWPQSEGTISKTEICGDESGSVDDDDVDDGLADKLNVPPDFHYRYFKEIRGLKRALGATPREDLGDVLVVREEYETLRQALEGDLKSKHSIVVTGHPGIGSYESWFSSLESNADFSPILRQDHLSLLPSFISS